MFLLGGIQHIAYFSDCLRLKIPSYCMLWSITFQWRLTEKVVCLLQPFEEFTKLLSSNNAPISAVIPTVSVLKHFLAKDDGDKSTGVRTMKKEFYDAITSCFERMLKDENYIIATTIDPCFKLAFTNNIKRV
jgi:hypothetical protein